MAAAPIAPRMFSVPMTAAERQQEATMYHPETMYELAKLKMAEDLRWAEHERMIRQAGSARPSGAIDSVRFRERLTRLLGAIWPPAPDGATPTAA
jgi:hypothetical protein